MYISYDYYRIFYYVAKYGSFSKAAEVLTHNQPNLTRTIKTLENELGCVLFTRSHKGVILTPEGEKLFEHISAAFEHFQAAEEELIENRSLKKGMVSIGATEIALRCFLLPILSRYKTRHPGVRLKISNSSTAEAVAMVENELIDLAIVTSPIEEAGNIVFKKLKSYKEIAICGEALKDEISAKEPLDFKELLSYPLVSLGKKSSTYRFYAPLFMHHGIQFAPDIEAATTDQIIPLVRHGMGVGFIPEDFLKVSPAGYRDIHPIKLTEPDPMRDIFLIKKHGHALSLPAKELEMMLLEGKTI